MSVFEKNKIRKLIAVGGEHRVYLYGDSQVVKFPFGPRYFLNPRKHTENILRDEEVSRKYFFKYLISRDLKFFEKNKKSSYVIIEPFICGQHLQKTDLKDDCIKKQFLDIVSINNKMLAQEDLAFDLFGVWGLLWRGSREVANVMVEEKTRRLVIIDPSVMHFGRHKDQQILVSSVTRWALHRQERLLRDFLK